MCKIRHKFYSDIVLGGSGEIESRKQGMMFVLGFLYARFGTIGFLDSLYDHKGLLTAYVCPAVFKPEYESALNEAWESLAESGVEINTDDACSRCPLR